MPLQQNASNVEQKIASIGAGNRPLTVSVIGILLVLLVTGLYILKPALFLSKASLDYLGKTSKVYISVPLHRSGALSSMNSVSLAFEQAKYHAGSQKISLIVMDDGDQDGKWIPDVEKSNADRAAADPDAIAYIGPQSSGAAKISMPILNKAGIAQISYSNTWPGLTKLGFAPGEPGIFYPTGIRHFVRVNPTDDLQGPVAALWARELGFRSVFVVDDGEAYGKGVSDLFTGKAKEISLNVLAHITINKSSVDFSKEAESIKKLNPDLVYFGGNTANGPTYLLQALREAGVKSKFMGPDGITEQGFIEKAGSDIAEGVYGTSIGAPALSIGTPEAEEYYHAYVNKYGIEPEIYGPFGYEAAKLLLSVIGRVGTDRARVIYELQNTKNFKGIFGTWSFDENGDTSLKLVSGSIVRNGKYEYIKNLNASF